MNRRNFVVGLGTVATISGVASVTAASFNDSVTPTTNFQIVPRNAELVVRRLQDQVDYSELADGNASWNATEINDFGNVTAIVGNDVVAYTNESENGQLLAQLAFNNTNEQTGNDTFTAYTDDDTNGNYGFFEVANLGDTDEDIGITFNFSTEVTDDQVLTEDEVAEMFTFRIGGPTGTEISPNSAANEPASSVTVSAGEVAIVGLEIVITEDVFGKIQDAAGGAFSPTESSIKLLESVNVGTDFTST